MRCIMFKLSNLLNISDIQKRLNSFQIIILGFMAMILLGTLLLMLPISSQERVVTPFSDCLFTAVSATCVTGLVVKDTATYWSLFGQIVILSLIQIGGMGVITIGLAIIRASGKTPVRIGEQIFHRPLRTVAVIQMQQMSVRTDQNLIC